MQDKVVAEGGVTSGGVHMQVGVESGELKEQSGGGVLLPVVGRQEDFGELSRAVVEQDYAEAVGGVSQLEGQAALNVPKATPDLCWHAYLLCPPSNTSNSWSVASVVS